MGAEATDAAAMVVRDLLVAAMPTDPQASVAALAADFGAVAGSMAEVAVDSMAEVEAASTVAAVDTVVVADTGKLQLGSFDSW